MNTSVIDSHFVTKKLKHKGNVLNYAQKHPTLAEWVVLNFTDMSGETGDPCWWDVLGGTGVLSTALCDLGVNFIYTEKDQLQYRLFLSMMETYEQKRAIDVLAVHKVPRVLLTRAAQHSVVVDDPALCGAWQFVADFHFGLHQGLSSKVAISNPNGLLLLPGFASTLGAVSNLSVRF